MLSKRNDRWVNMNNLPKINIFSRKRTAKNARSLYFDDLIITSAFHKKFPNGEVHHKSECKPWVFSLEMILQGSVKLHLDSKTILLEGPSVFWIGDKSKTFQFEMIPGESYEHLWTDFTGERGRRIYEALSNEYPDSFIKLKDSPNIQNIKDLYDFLEQRFSLTRRPTSMIEDVLLVEQILGEILFEAKQQETSNDPYGLLALSETIQNAPFKKYDLRKLAAEAGLSYIHFRRVFKEKFGEPIHKYILRQRMLTAGKLLKSGRFWIGELSDYCGFPNISSFSRAFKLYYKMSPREWLTKNDAENS